MTVALILMVCLAGYMEMKMEGVMAYYKKISQKVSSQTTKTTTDHGKNNGL